MCVGFTYGLGTIRLKHGHNPKSSGHPKNLSVEPIILSN
jgi:hypothetical protein